MQRLPRVKGYMRTAVAMNRLFLKAGASPTFQTDMKLGHRLIVDARGPQSVAAFTGKYDDSQIRCLQALLPVGGVILDVGANIGYYTFPLALMAKQKNARVVAFEPFPKNCERLRANIDLNGLASYVDLQPFALSSEAGTAMLALREDFSEGGEVGNASIVHDKQIDGEFKQVPITLVRLDDIWPTLGLNRLDLIKADIEGLEDLFLQGARQTLERFRPIIQMEINRSFYESRGVDIEVAVPAALPSGHRFFRMNGAERFVPISDLSVFRDVANPFDEAFAAPEEKSQLLPQ